MVTSKNPPKWLCDACNNSAFAAAAGPCPDCGMQTFAGFKHCKTCAVTYQKCGACDEPIN